ncbi:protein NUCLEAR FUSION DEFECTIVE 4-like [Syzygium oleosum]|uniref:protein NUCLEAR FUSION DEFECTIVE 4-like n=1 Tax=Syzygium oleosum TaxID=219896 RepID=UPI0024B8C703|nr:protein NUCLEAR FUSION DEFECTIVE 4-like [Syzygium oleosum]
MAVLMAPMVGAYLLLLSPATAALYVSTAIIGICTGAITSISVATTTELFGTKNFGVNHNILVTNIPIGSFVFGYAAALLYRSRRGGDGKCMGMECYSTTFVILVHAEVLGPEELGGGHHRDGRDGPSADADDGGAHVQQHPCHQHPDWVLRLWICRGVALPQPARRRREVHGDGVL